MRDKSVIGRWLLRVSAFLIVPMQSPAHASGVALTFDDVPGITMVNDDAYVRDFNERLLKSLRHSHIPATGFLIGERTVGDDKAPEREIARQWKGHSLVLGNHTYSHESVNTLGTQAYLADVAKGEAVLEELVYRGHPETHWFRAPYLETGSPEAVRKAVDVWLAEHKLKVAPVTIENSDYVFATVYEAAITAGDNGKAQAVRAAYLSYTKQMIDWSRKAARSLFGRDIDHVMLLHDTRLNADCMDDLAGVFRKSGMHFVSLRKAMADPAYTTEDRYAGSRGIGWLERWSLTLNRSLDWGNFSEPPAAIEKEYEVLDDDPRP